MGASRLSRRDFLRLQLYGTACLAAGGVPGLLACDRKQGRETGVKVIVLGLDGMEPHIVHRMMRQGKLPTFSKIAAQGCFGFLGTSNPPQSPVAWANFISGCNPGGHGIFDFIHRDPATYLPYLSTSKTEPSGKSITLGDHVIPLSSGKVLDLRRGRAFWEILEEHDIPATVFKIPTNFPPTPTRQKTFSGMGTPDILGSYGIFSFFTEQPLVIDPDLGGGKVYPISLTGQTARARLVGPGNAYRKGTPDATVEFTVYRDPLNPVVKIVVGDREILLREKEWSPWVRVGFPMMPGVKVRGICQFYLPEVHPHLKLYVSPIHLDPADPALPLSTPADYARELERRFGPFHTKGLPADTKALDHGVLDEEAFLAQDEGFLREQTAIYDYELDRLESGLLFFYVSSTDQRSHMFWRLTDPKHPAYDAKLAAHFGGVIEQTYRQMDELLDRTLRRVDSRTMLMVLSDHGFTPYTRSFHLNSWLKDQGYLALIDEAQQGEKEFFQNVDWSRTRAYALGFNGLYINQRGRESRGIVPAMEKRSLLDELADRLEKLTDPETGGRPVWKGYQAHSCYSGPYREQGPDLLVGYNRGYRASWQTALGKIPRRWVETNDKKWSGDHCMAPDLLPGILLLNRTARRAADASLVDLTATILDAFQIPKPQEMDGTSIL